MFGDNSINIIIKAVDNASGVFRTVSSSIEQHRKQFEQTADASKSFAIGLGAAVAAVGGLGYAALKSAGDMEQTRIAFTTMLGSGEKAQAFMDQLVSFAKRTPFTLTGLQDASKQLMAYGIEQEKVIPNLTSLGNIAAGVGMDKLPNLIMAFGQVKAATHLTGMELRQFTEAGVPLLDILSRQFGVSVEEIQKMVSAGTIGFSDVEKALVSLSGEGGRFNDLMDKQSQSLGGMVSNLQDAWNIFLANQGQRLIEWAKDFVQVATYIVQNVLPVWIDKIGMLVDFLDRNQVVLYIVAGAIVGALVPAIWAAVTAFAALMVALAPFMIAGAIVGGIVAGIVWMVKHWDLVTDAVQRVIDKFQWLIDIYNKIVDIFKTPVNIVVNGFGGTGNVSGAGSAPSFVNPNANWFTGGTHEFGGVIPGPAGTIQPTLMHAGERVIPAGGSTGGVYITNNFPSISVRNDSDIDAIRTMLNDAMRPLLQNAKLVYA